MKTIHKTLNIWYYSAFVLAILAATCGYFSADNQAINICQKSSLGVGIYSAIILYVIVSAPLALKFFSLAVEKNRAKDDEILRKKKYLRLAKIRLAIVTFGLISALFFAYILGETSLLWLAGISAIVLYLCKPTKAKIEADLATPEINQTENK